MKVYLILGSIILVLLLLLVITIVICFNNYKKQKAKIKSLDNQLCELKKQLSLVIAQNDIKTEVEKEAKDEKKTIYNLSGSDKYNAINNRLHNN